MDVVVVAVRDCACLRCAFAIVAYSLGAILHSRWLRAAPDLCIPDDVRDAEFAEVFYEPVGCGLATRALVGIWAAANCARLTVGGVAGVVRGGGTTWVRATRFANCAIFAPAQSRSLLSFSFAKFFLTLGYEALAKQSPSPNGKKIRFCNKTRP